MTKQQQSIIEYHRLHPSKSRKEIAEAFGIRIYFVNKAFDRYKIEQQQSQTSLFNETKPKKKQRVGNCPSGWREVYEYHKGFNPMVYSIPAKLFCLEMEKTRWRYEGVYIANWKMTYVNWLRDQVRKKPYLVQAWTQHGKLF